MGEILVQQNKFDEGLNRLNQARKLWQKVLGEAHPDLCVNLEMLARLYCRQGQWDQAESCYRRSLEMKERFLGPVHRETIKVLGSLATVLTSLDRPEEGRSLHMDVILRREKAKHAPPPTDLETPQGGRYSQAQAAAQHYARQAAGPARFYTKYREARHLYLRALFTREQALGPDHVDISFALDDLAELYKRHRKYESALELYQRTLVLRKRALGNFHPDVCLSLRPQILIMCAQERWSDAKPLAQTWLEIVAATVGAEHPEYANVLEIQAKIYGGAGALEWQEECNRKALEVRRQALGTGHPDFAVSLADLLFLQEDYEESSRLYRFVVTSIEEKLGPDSVKLIPVYEKYAVVLHKLNQPSLAVELETQVTVLRAQHGLDFGEPQVYKPTG